MFLFGRLKKLQNEARRLLEWITRDQPVLVDIKYGGAVSKSMLRAAVDMANQSFPEEFRVDFEVVEGWLSRDPHTILIFTDGRGLVAGYTSVFHVSAKTYESLLRGEICDWDICHEGPLSDDTIELEDELYFYIGAVVVREDLRGSDVFKIIQKSIMAHIEGITRGGEKRAFVACEIASEAAKRAALRMGLMHRSLSLDGLPIYAGSLKRYP